MKSARIVESCFCGCMQITLVHVQLHHKVSVRRAGTLTAHRGRRRARRRAREGWGPVRSIAGLWPRGLCTAARWQSRRQPDLGCGRARQRPSPPQSSARCCPACSAPGQAAKTGIASPVEVHARLLRRERCCHCSKKGQGECKIHPCMHGQEVGPRAGGCKGGATCERAQQARRMLL
jgi:hypothetical protein